MKFDVLTVTALLFIVGVLMSSLGITEDLVSQSNMAPPSALQQGISTH